MKVITVKGDEHSGKTSLITQVYEELLRKKEEAFYFKSEGANNQDFKALLKYNKKKIAFCSIGDPADLNKETNYEHLSSEYILSGLVFASKNEADVLVNAYREPFKEFPEPVYEGIIGKNNYHSFPVTKQTDLAGLKNQIISMISK